MRTQLVLHGRVFDAATRGPIAGIHVKAHLGKNGRAVASGSTDASGHFAVTVSGHRAVVRVTTEFVRFGLYLREGRIPIHLSRKYRFEELADRIEIEVPDSSLKAAFDRPRIGLLADGEPARQIEVGQTLSLRGTHLRPSSDFEISVRIGGKTASTSILTSDAFGRLEDTVVASQLGLSAFDSQETYTLDEARKRLGGRTLTVLIRFRGERVAERKATIARQSSRPIGFVSDKAGRLRNFVQADDDALHLTLSNLAESLPLRIFVVPRQADWLPGDPVRPAADRQGRPLTFELAEGGGTRTVRLAPAGRLLPGAYDLIVRPIRYGFEADEEPRLQPRDLVIGRHITGLVVREDFWRAKPVLGGCVNAFDMSGSPVSGRPYFRYRDTFAVGENVWAALDPGIVAPGLIGKKAALFVVQSKTAAGWGADTGLTHVPPGSPAEITLQAGCINANKALVWPSASTKGSYDIVADFGNNSANPAAFSTDGSYDTPLDMIDGYFQPGFRVVDDPGTMADFAHVGAFSVDAALLSGLGLGANLTVIDEDGAYFTPGDFVPVSDTFPRLAIVRFPADGPGATSAAQLSLARPDYPLAVVVHGNGHDYTSYAFLLEHLARNGFIAMSIHIPNGRRGLARANAFLDHLATIRQIFGARLQNNVAVLGHSRGGEAVFKIARLNQENALGIGLRALVSLGPTDQYGRETITGVAAVPLLVLYGAKDADVSGWPPYAGYDVRQSGFSLYDRFDDAVKSMAFVIEATHNGFVTHNEISVALSVADQRKILLAYTNAFFRQHVYGETEWTGLFTGEWKPPSVGTTPAEIHFQYRETVRRVVDHFEGAHTATSWQTSSLGGAVSETGLPATPIETQLYPQDNQSPHDTGGLRLVWDNLGDRLSIDVPAGQRDVSAYGAISIRAGQVLGSPSNPPVGQNFRLTLRDGSGNERAIRVGAFGSVPVPAEANVAGNKKSSLSTIRIPLASFKIVCAGAPIVDLTDVAEVRLDFSEITAGEIAVDEIEFTN